MIPHWKKKMEALSYLAGEDIRDALAPMLRGSAPLLQFCTEFEAAARARALVLSVQPGDIVLLLSNYPDPFPGVISELKLLGPAATLQRSVLRYQDGPTVRMHTYDKTRMALRGGWVHAVLVIDDRAGPELCKI